MMMRPLRRSSFAALLVAFASTVALVACGGSAKPARPSSSTSGEPKSSNGLIVVAPMQLVVSKAGEESKTVLELRADGTIWTGDREVASVQGDSIVSLQGKTLMTLSAAGVVDVPLAGKKATFDATDVLVSDEGKAVGVRDDGTPFFRGAERGSDTFPGRFVGFAPEARRTAVMLTVLLLIAMASDAPPPTTAAATTQPPP